MEKIRINTSVGIIGCTMTSKIKNGDNEEFRISQSGTSKAFHIPPVLVYCEDKLAKEIIEKSLNDFDRCSLKFIYCGSWKNIVIALAGSLLYSEELKNTGTTKYIDAVGIIDGDITDKDISETIQQCFKGNGIPSELKSITKKIKQHITQFKISEDVLRMNGTKGKPELNLKLMLEGIQKHKISKLLSPRLEELREILGKCSDEHRPGVKVEIYHLTKKLEETLKIIEISKSLTEKRFKKFNNGRILFDYHFYLSKMEKELTNHSLRYYSYTNYPLLILTRIIKEFDKESWDDYVLPVISLLTKYSDSQRERFSHNTFNNQVLD